MNKRLSCCFCFVFGNIFVGFCEWISAIDFDILALPITERSQKMAERENDEADTKYTKVYALMDWGWTREDCIAAIQQEGLPLPGKSS